MVHRSGRLLHLLTGGDRDLPERQRSMRAALDWSANLLDDDEAELFAQLSVFSGGWTIAAGEAVCPVGDEPFDLMARLVDKNLVVADGSGRLSMLETVREYAAERLAAGPGEVARAVRDRHAQYYAELARELGPVCRSSPDATTRARLDAEAGNMSAALEHTAAVDDAEVLAELVVGLLDYWFFSGPDRARRALAADHAGDRACRSRSRPSCWGWPAASPSSRATSTARWPASTTPSRPPWRRATAA